MTGDGFLVAGRLSVDKGIAILLEAWRRHPDGALGSLRIAGDGPLAGLVREHAGARSDIEYLGALDHDGVVAAMRRSSVVVVPSVWDEVCPMVAIEAMANASASSCTYRGGLPWLVGATQEHRTPAGWLVEPEVDALAAALSAARAGASNLSDAARHRYEERFTPARGTASLTKMVYEACRPVPRHKAVLRIAARSGRVLLHQRANRRQRRFDVLAGAIANRAVGLDEHFTFGPLRNVVGHSE